MGRKIVRRMDREYNPYAAVQIPPCGMVKKPVLTQYTCRIYGKSVVHDRFFIARYRAIGLRADLVFLQDLTAILLRLPPQTPLPPANPKGERA